MSLHLCMQFGLRSGSQGYIRTCVRVRCPQDVISLIFILRPRSIILCLTNGADHKLMHTISIAWKWFKHIKSLFSCIIALFNLYIKVTEVGMDRVPPPVHTHSMLNINFMLAFGLPIQCNGFIQGFWYIDAHKCQFIHPGAP